MTTKKCVIAGERGLMPDNSWKVFERWVCRLFGGERWWEDAIECKGTGMFSPEAKYRKKIPDWLEKMIIQAENQARDDQLGLVVLTEHHRPRMQSLVIIRLQDFYDFFVGDSVAKQPRVDGENESDNHLEGG